MIGGAAVQGIELRRAFLIKTDDLGIQNGGALDAACFLDNARIAVGPVVAVHREQPHPTIADVDLQPVAVMFQLVHPTRANRGALGNDRTTGVDETGRRVERLPARVTRHAGDINGRFWNLKLNINHYAQRPM